MKLSLLKPRIEAMTEFADVRGAAALAIAMQHGQFSRSAFVYLKRRQSGKNTLVNAISQRTTERFGVAYWTRDFSDPDGDAALDAASDLSDALIAQLLGWTPDTNIYEPFTHVSSETLLFKATVGLLWADEFESSYLIRSVT